MDKIITAHNIFKNLDNLKYIDLIDANNTFNNITETQLNKKDALIVCQKENLITNEKAKYQCCYYNTNNHICESDHYIILISGKNIIYESGFMIKADEKEIRNNMLFTIINRKKIDNNDELNILPNTKIEIHFPSDIKSLENFFNINYDKNVEYIEKIDLSPFNSSSIKTMSHLFHGCRSLNSIDFTKFDSSSAIDMSYMFSGCISLEFINLPNFNTESVTNMSGMFSGCNLITSFNLSNFNTKSTTDMSGMFSGCNSTELIDLSSFNTELVINMSNMFSGCNLITSLNLSSFNTELVTNMSNMFSGCNLITSLNLSSFNTANTIDMSEMFYGCDNLEILDISNFVATKCDSYNNMFSDYVNLKYIDIKNLKNYNILKDSFNNTKLFYVCQWMDLIRNSFAYNCCVYDIENHECDYIPPPTTILESTIIDESTFLIGSTEYDLNNQLNESTEQILSSEKNEITESIPNTQIKDDTTSQNSETTILSTEISESTEQIYLLQNRKPFNFVNSKFVNFQKIFYKKNQ